jgi:hypothetical protein
MTTMREIQTGLQAHLDLLYNKGYELGFNTILEDLELIADSWWNNGFTTPAEMLRMEIKKLRGDE